MQIYWILNTILQNLFKIFHEQITYFMNSNNILNLQYQTNISFISAITHTTAMISSWHIGVFANDVIRHSLVSLYLWHGGRASGHTLAALSWYPHTCAHVTNLLYRARDQARELVAPSRRLQLPNNEWLLYWIRTKCNAYKLTLHSRLIMCYIQFITSLLQF